jgi:hypothetical protein
MQPDPRTAGPLSAVLADLATMPDDAPELHDALDRLIQLVVATVPAVDYASSTVHRNGKHSTVAFSSELAVAVDMAQYEDAAGPCVAAAEGTLSSVPDTVTVMHWPRFREAAVDMGLRSTLSIPLFTASGQPAIAMNLYAHEPAILLPLAMAVDNQFHQPRLSQSRIAAEEGGPLDEGSRELLSGLGTALGIRDVIQRAIGVVMARDHVDAATGYTVLRLGAAETGRTIIEHAQSVTAQQGASETG